VIADSGSYPAEGAMPKRLFRSLFTADRGTPSLRWSHAYPPGLNKAGDSSQRAAKDGALEFARL
jgi:hypothetical protein